MGLRYDIVYIHPEDGIDVAARATHLHDAKMVAEIFAASDGALYGVVDRETSTYVHTTGHDLS